MKTYCIAIGLAICGCGLSTQAVAQDLQSPSSAPTNRSRKVASTANFSISEEKDGLTITVDGELFARYVVDQANKPYLWPIIGPTGIPMTRAYPMEDLANELKKQRDHPHHRGLLFGHESIRRSAESNDKQDSAGGDTWHERATFEHRLNSSRTASEAKRRIDTLASIKHREFTELTANADRAAVTEICDYVDRDGGRFLTEERRMTFQVTANSRIIDFDQTFIANEGDIVFEDRKDAGLSIRVHPLMAVDSKQGGHIINSVGLADNDAWSQPAKWCDYHGIIEGEHLGIAILNHPSSYRFPTRWHVRGYGLFAANPFARKSFDNKLADNTTTLKKGESLKLKHRFIFHQGNAATTNIENAWRRYAKDDQ